MATTIILGSLVPSAADTAHPHRRRYAKQAKNKSLEADAFEIRKHAERRLGAMMEEQKKTVGLANGARQKGIGKRGSSADPRSLAKQGAAHSVDEVKDIHDRSHMSSASRARVETVQDRPESWLRAAPQPGHVIRAECNCQ